LSVGLKGLENGNIGVKGSLRREHDTVVLVASYEI
jgi:hypothetical protein